MPRPRRSGRILGKPRFRCFKPEGGVDPEKLEPIEITLEELEALRLKDYHKIQQKNAAEIMDISQPTFNRILNSARGKVARSLVEGKIIQITGGNYIMGAIKYKCGKCGFEWQNPKKEYQECPDCGSSDIKLFEDEEKIPETIGQPGLGRRKSYGGDGIGAGPPRVCKCTSCGYETKKVRAVPCRTSKCPECGAPLCGAD
ncbi:MAG TPA: DUF134 domain-containing protein [Methanobacteriaceae archaeon]|nr:DUF134 domain-containing protein [Methanobacteriaceae archaeon]